MSNCPESSAVVETSTTLNDVLSGEKAIPEHWFDENGPTGGLNNEIIQKVALASGLPAWIVLSAITGLHHAQQLCHALAVNGGWWSDLETGERKERNKAELLCLIHSEVSEAMEGERKNKADDKLPHRPMAEVELADVLIRTFDYAGGFSYDLAAAMVEKMAFNATRADHKPENRKAAGGKSF